MSNISLDLPEWSILKFKHFNHSRPILRNDHRPIVGCPIPTSRGISPKLKRRMNPNTTKICWIIVSIADNEFPVGPETWNENNGTKNATDVLRESVEKNLGVSMLWSLVSFNVALSLRRSCWEWDLGWLSQSSSHQTHQLEQSQQMRNQSFPLFTHLQILFPENFLNLNLNNPFGCTIVS